MKTIQGRKYIFIIEASKTHFAIRARCKRSRRFSHINNLNAILSEFNVDIDDPRGSESTWDVNPLESRKFVKIAENFLSCKSFRDYLERQLDVDRSLGVWASIEL